MPSRILPIVLLILVQEALGAQDTVQLDPFTVTAQKRVQVIAEVPVPIVAYSGHFLERTGITGYKDLATLVPGLFVAEQSPNVPRFNMRGVTTDSGDPRLAPRISIFQDGVSISRSRGSLVELFDLERVEVLKGPHGTLFGRGAETGAIAIVQNKAKNETSGRITAGVGDYHERHASGYFNFPVVKDELFGRIAYAHRKYDGVLENLVDGSRLNGQDMLALRGALHWQALRSTSIDVLANWQHDTPPGTALKSGIIPTSRGETNPFSAAELTRGSELGVDRTIHGVSVTAEHEFSPAWSLTSISGWREFDSYDRLDSDGARIYLIELDDDVQGRQFSQEVRVNYNGRGRFSGFAGIGFLNDSGTARVPLMVDERQNWPFLSGSFRAGLITALAPMGAAGLAIVDTAVPLMNPFVPQERLPAGFAAFAAAPAPLNALAGLANAPLQPRRIDEFTDYGRTRSVDVFADGTYRLTPRLELTAGLRVTRDRVDSAYEASNGSFPTLGFIVNNIPGYPYLPTNGRRTANELSSSWDGRAITRYVFSKSVNAFASVSRGHRPPCLVLDSTTTTRLSEETIVNYETGLKGTVGGGRLQWSGSLYRYNYRHFQTRVLTLGKFSQDDAGNATGRGVELSVQGRVIEGLDVFANYAHTDATFDATDGKGVPQQFASYSFRLSPRTTYSAGGTATIRMRDAGQLSFTPSWSYRSRHYFSDDNAAFNFGLKQEGYGLANVRLGWRSQKGRWQLTTHVRNVFDREYLIDAGNIGSGFGLPTFIPGAPRRFGIEATTHW